MTTAIKVEGLSKRYLIGHQRRESSQTLRDSLARLGKSTLRRWLHLFRSSSSPADERSAKTEEFWALSDVAFEVRQGERLAIIGPNGAGKTTLLKILSRITTPTTGRVSLNGRVASLLEVGTGFHPELTGRENIYLNGAILGMTMSDIKARFDEIVSFAEVERFLDTPVKRYSSGMYVRLAFAVAAHLEPEILIVDEVLAVGDVHFQRKCLGKMDSVSRQGRTVLFVSHNMPAVLRLCSRGLYLSHGSLVMDDDVDRVVDHYLTSSQMSVDSSSINDRAREGSLGESFRFCECSLRNSANQPTSSIGFGEPFSIDLEAVSTSQLHDLSIIVRIESKSGEAITGPASEDQDLLFSCTPSHPLRLSVSFRDLILTPDTYWITISARCGKVGYDQVERAMGFEVLHSPFGGLRPHSGTWGFVHVKPTWATIDPPR